jgi:hypothetical protein
LAASHAQIVSKVDTNHTDRPENDPASAVPGIGWMRLSVGAMPPPDAYRADPASAYRRVPYAETVTPTCSLRAPRRRAAFASAQHEYRKSAPAQEPRRGMTISIFYFT